MRESRSSHADLLPDLGLALAAVVDARAISRPLLARLPTGTNLHNEWVG